MKASEIPFVLEEKLSFTFAKPTEPPSQPGCYKKENDWNIKCKNMNVNEEPAKGSNGRLSHIYLMSYELQEVFQSINTLFYPS